MIDANAATAGLTYRFVAPSRADTPRLARDWMAMVLRAARWQGPVEPARLCTSEVVTNAYRHTDTAEIAVEAALTDGCLTVYVYDSAPERWPAVGRGLLDSGGRGLALVAAYADDWSVVTAGGAGKAVWFRFGSGTGAPAVGPGHPPPALEPVRPVPPR
ncbi:ATP-binding protein [Streptomyces vinaceus]|uniref:ATP-binding protein n=1 Tax=Streptomyces vinaceus TaxID=1960 RepID=UPI0037F75A9A